MLAPNEIDLLADTVNRTPAIKIVHFTGGEPTLHMDQLVLLQKKINRPVEYAMTTNGWFVDELDRVFGRIKIDRIDFSFDSFHEPFLSREKALKFVDIVVARGIQLQLNWVYKEFKEIAALAEFAEKGVTIALTPIVEGGRANAVNPNDRNSHESTGTCPSLVPSLREAGVEKINYLAGKGFTPCCGPLVFDQLREDAFLFSPSWETYASNALYQNLTSGTFAAQAEKAGIDRSAMRQLDACAACVKIHRSPAARCG